MSRTSYLGKLLAANPVNPRDSLNRSVILIVSDTDQATLGLQINRPLTNFDLVDVGDQMGLYLNSNQPVYYGGNVTPNKIHIIHSRDWTGLTTIDINDQLCLTNDVSVLAAISENRGPEYIRACAGFWGWEAGQLCRQLSKDTGRGHRWEYCDATAELVFGEFGPGQHWEMVLEAAARAQISSWF